MSKAFTREADGVPEPPVPPRPPSLLPLGAKNYLTVDGARRLQAELDRLIQIEQPKIPVATGDSDARRKHQLRDQRIRHLHQTLATAVPVEPPAKPWEQVRFGASVTIRHNDEQAHYRIVGIDETDADRGWISWLSPIAKALLNARLGQRVRLKLPSGEVELEIVGIEYETHEIQSQD